MQDAQWTGGGQAGVLIALRSMGVSTAANLAYSVADARGRTGVVGPECDKVIPADHPRRPLCEK